MNREEIDYWLRLFSNNNKIFMSKDGKKITLFKVFQELKELQYLLKIKNDYIKELEAYKYNMNRDYLRLEKENEELKDNWNKLRETLKNEQLGSILYSDKKRFADIDEILLKIQELESSDSNE